jgi:hypothetical protein
MRKIITMTSLLFAVVFVQATVRTVSNNPATLAQFNTIQAAIGASGSGDTIYVHGSPNDYAGFTIEDKRLIIIGPGWSPDKTFPFTARVGNTFIGGTGGDPLTNATNNSEIHGLTFISNVQSYVNYGNDHPNGLKFIRNEFQGTVYVHEGGTYKNYLFEGNYFNTGRVQANGSANYENFLFQNNVFYDLSTWQLHDFSNSTNVLLNHNLWYGPTGATAAPCFSGTCRFLTLTNNIFVKRNAATSNSFSVFNNNITFNAVANTPWTVNSNSDAGGNVANADPQMADQTAINAGTNNPLLNFTIAAGPANNTGSDGKDIGLLFDASGSLNWTNSRNSRLPRVYTMNITNPTIPAGGTLNVQVDGRKSN